MNVLQALKNATSLEKARVCSVYWKPQFYRNKIKESYLKEVEDILQDYKLVAYKDTILKDFKQFQGKPRDWNRKKRQIIDLYINELVKGCIIKEMDNYTNLSQIKSDVLIEWSEILASLLVGNDLKTNQIRKFLDGVRKVEVNVKKKRPEDFTSSDVVFLKVHLAYAQARQKSVKPLMLVINNAINMVKESGTEGYKDFEQLVKFTEAIVAYHRFYGGSD